VSLDSANVSHSSRTAFTPCIIVDRFTHFRCCQCGHLLGKFVPPVNQLQIRCRCGTFNNLSVQEASVTRSSVLWLVRKWHGEDIEIGFSWQWPLTDDDSV
jgi:phage FluMu protein Com